MSPPIRSAQALMRMVLAAEHFKEHGVMPAWAKAVPKMEKQR